MVSSRRLSLSRSDLRASRRGRRGPPGKLGRIGLTRAGIQVGLLDAVKAIAVFRNVNVPILGEVPIQTPIRKHGASGTAAANDDDTGERASSSDDE